MTPPPGMRLATSVSLAAGPGSCGLVCCSRAELELVSALTSLLACPAALSRSPADADRPGRKPWISEMYGYSFGASSSNVWHHVDYAAMLYPTYKPIGEWGGSAGEGSSAGMCVPARLRAAVWQQLSMPLPCCCWVQAAAGRGLGSRQPTVTCFIAHVPTHSSCCRQAAYPALGPPGGVWQLPLAEALVRSGRGQL